ncbi:hypothetical protein ACWDUL_38395 [Nocardia niigatensis]
MSTSTAAIRPYYLDQLDEVRARLRDTESTGDEYRIKWARQSLELCERGAREIEDLIAVGIEHGWQHIFVAKYRHQPDRLEILEFTRGEDEFLRVGLGYSVNSVFGQVATGPVSSRSVSRHDAVHAEDVRALLQSQPRAQYPATEWVLVVGEGRTERRPYETACNFSVHLLRPGVYPVELTRGGQMLAIVPTTRIRDHYVNQMFQHSSVSDTTPNIADRLYLTFWASSLDREPQELPDDMTGAAVYIRRADLPEGYEPAA